MDNSAHLLVSLQLCIAYSRSGECCISLGRKRLLHLPFSLPYYRCTWNTCTTTLYDAYYHTILHLLPMINSSLHFSLSDGGELSVSGCGGRTYSLSLGPLLYRWGDCTTLPASPPRYLLPPTIGRHLGRRAPNTAVEPFSACISSAACLLTL